MIWSWLASKPLQLHKLALPVDDLPPILSPARSVAGRLFATGLQRTAHSYSLPGDGQRRGISRGAAAAISPLRPAIILANASGDVVLTAKAAGRCQTNRFRGTEGRCRFPSPQLSVWRLRAFATTLSG